MNAFQTALHNSWELFLHLYQSDKWLSVHCQLYRWQLGQKTEKKIDARLHFVFVPIAILHWNIAI